ncbi:MAG: hypothetical protein H7A53_10300 [Akkermansiaceae bacterium]|nr:hypothetical protein [Akkermansiaceae bacterium]MCP5551266.1 hypothetical protein [Akkermansiaceae bacterium]
MSSKKSKAKKKNGRKRSGTGKGGGAGGFGGGRAGREKQVAGIAAELRGLLAELRSVNEDLKRYEEEDVPAFRAWLDKHYGGQRDEAARLKDELEEKEEMLDEIFYRTQDGEFRTEAEAHEAVKREREGMAGMFDRGGAPGPEFDVGDDFDPFAFEAGTDGDAPPDFVVDSMLEVFLNEVRGIDINDMSEAEYEKARADFVKSFEHMQAGDRQAFDKTVARLGADESRENTSAVKAVYRRLAKRLHPDSNGDLTPEEKELWEQAGMCYKLLDFRGLRRLELICAVRADDSLPVEWLKELKALLGDLEIEFEYAIYDLEEAQGDIAWGFAGKKKGLAALRRKVEADFVEMIAELRRHLSVAELRLKYLTRKRKPRRKKAAAKKKTTTARKKTAAAKKKTAAAKKTKPKAAKPESGGRSRQAEFDF